MELEEKICFIYCILQHTLLWTFYACYMHSVCISAIPNFFLQTQKIRDYFTLFLVPFWDKISSKYVVRTGLRVPYASTARNEQLSRFPRVGPVAAIAGSPVQSPRRIVSLVSSNSNALERARVPSTKYSTVRNIPAIKYCTLYHLEKCVCVCINVERRRVRFG